ncbi:hypothetical protein SBC1_37860 (plasmid) [Caballeronia sp. SBC1]|nr:hypothetical protein SBC2_50080 [Caballeronia sp. SBC2]QIN63746.1 hypothetical protein SBC1_37860 [Caballeronia sp. SBC1]
MKVEEQSLLQLLLANLQAIAPPAVDQFPSPFTLTI